MRISLLTLTGPSATLVAALQSGQIPTKRLLGVRKSNVLDGQFEALYLGDDIAVDKKVMVDIPDGIYGPNHVIALRGADDTVQGHMLIEDTRLDITDANAIADILIAGGYNEQGKVHGTHDGSILMPANVESDRARIRLADATYIDVDTSDFGDKAKLTASLAITPNGTNLLLIGAEGDTALYAKPVATLIEQAKAGKVDDLGDYVDLGDDILNRIARSKGADVQIHTDKGVIQAKADNDGVKLGDKVEAKVPLADDVDALGTWDMIGDTDAVLDGAGSRSQAWVTTKQGGGVTVMFAAASNKGNTGVSAQV